MDAYEIRKLKLEIQSRSNSLTVYEPKLSKMEQEVENRREEIRTLRQEARVNLNSIAKLLRRMGKEGETYLQSIAPEILTEVKNSATEETDEPEGIEGSRTSSTAEPKSRETEESGSNHSSMLP